MRKNNLILSLLSVLISSFFIVSCVSTNQENVNTERSNLSYNKIDDYTIEISGTENLKYVYFYQSPKYFNYKDFSRDLVSKKVVEDICSNISFLIGYEEYYLKFSYDYENENLFEFVVVDKNERKVKISGNDNIILQSKRAMSFSDPIIDTKLKFDEKEIGRKKYPYDCLIAFDYLRFAKKTKVEQEEIDAKQERLDLARRIICKKYGFKFKSVNDFINWRTRIDFDNLYISLSAGSYSNAIPFVEGDIIFTKENMLTIEDMSYTNSGYLYLVTASKNQISKCCMIISPRQLNYMNYYGSRITESLVLRFEGKYQYQQGYRYQNCDVFTVIERNSKEYNEYMSKIKDMASIEQNPYAYADILK